MIDWPRPDILGHMLHSNIALLVNRQTKDDFATLCATDLTERKIAARYDASSTFPLWVYSVGANRIDLHDGDLISELPGRCANLNPSFVGAILDAMGLSTTDWQPESRSAPLRAENIFHYIYAVLHCPSYRERYAGFLRIAFPRIPIPGTYQLFAQLAALGAQLMKWHLLEHPSAIAISATSAPAGMDVPVFFGTNRRLQKVAEKARAIAATCSVVGSTSGHTTTTTMGKVFINGESGFENVDQQVWQHTIGGYQVLHKWLDDRRKAGRSLSDDDIAHWRRIYASLQATQALMAQVDQVINAHGGWPDAADSAQRAAFSTRHPPPDPATLAAMQAPLRRARFKPVSQAQHGLSFAADAADEMPEAVTPAGDAVVPDKAIRPAAIDDADAMRELRKVLGETR